MIKLDQNGMPRSDARNAYELLEDVCRLFREEPRVLYMANVAMRVGDHTWYDRERELLSASPCGTIGCVAGWTCMLTGLSSVQAQSWEAARILLGRRDFCGKISTDLNNLFFENFPDQEIEGTPAAAEHVVRRVRAFMSKHEEALKAREVRT